VTFNRWGFERVRRRVQADQQLGVGHVRRQLAAAADEANAGVRNAEENQEVEGPFRLFFVIFVIP
jgi:hypothetical protein